DAFAEAELSFDVAMRVAGAEIDSIHLLDKDGSELPSYNEDRLCALDARLFLSKNEVVVRRLSLLGALDAKSEKGTRPDCDSDGPERIAVRLSQVKIAREGKGPPQVRGHLLARLPLRLADRAAPSMRGTGWVGFSGDIAMAGDSQLPE